MTDWLQRAWNVLEKEERPEGLHWWEIGKPFRDVDAFFSNDTITRDRLTVAVEGVLLSEGMSLEVVDEDYVWGRFPDCAWGRFPDVYGCDGDRLTAAVLALEAVRKGSGPST